MSWFDIIFAALIIIMTVYGARRGIIISLLSMLKFAAGIPVSYFISNNLYQKLYDGYVKQYLYDGMAKRLSEASADSIVTDIKDFASSLPGDLAKEFDMARLDSLSVDELSRSVTDSLLQPIILAAIKIIVFVASFIIFCIIISIVISLVRKIRNRKNAPLKKTGSFFGGVFGFIKSLILICAVVFCIGILREVLPADNIILLQADKSYIIDFINSVYQSIK